jgi:hypothetical protein
MSKLSPSILAKKWALFAAWPWLWRHCRHQRSRYRVPQRHSSPPARGPSSRFFSDMFRLNGDGLLVWSDVAEQTKNNSWCKNPETPLLFWHFSILVSCHRSWNWAHSKTCLATCSVHLTTVAELAEIYKSWLLPSTTLHVSFSGWAWNPSRAVTVLKGSVTFLSPYRM